MAVQRRLAAILAADVAGYSRLMGEDEEGTLDALTAHRTELIEPCISEHRGRVVKTTGDGLLAEFASVVDAVRCAVAFQKGMAERNDHATESRRIEFRIGVNLGDVIIQDDDVFGDGVNIAARLEGLAETGGICVSGTVFDQVGRKLDVQFDDLGAQTFKNIAEPVRTYRAQINSGASRSIRDERPLPQPDKPSIAVLPFENMSDDPEQQYFSDGLSEDIITDLSKISGLFVIARNSSFVYRGKTVNASSISRELGVRHVLEGSVRRAGDRVRISAQLIDGDTNGHLWAERYDRDLSDIFAVQDEIVGDIVKALTASLSADKAMRAASSMTDNMEAYDLFLRGRDLVWQQTREANESSKPVLEHAIELSPNFAPAYTTLAAPLIREYVNGWAEHPQKSLARAHEMAQQAVALDDLLPQAHWTLGLAQMWMRQLDQAAREVERAIKLDPNFADAYAALGQIHTYAGNPADGIEPLKMAMRLDPHYRDVFLHFLGQAQFMNGQFNEAVETLQRRLIRRPDTDITRVLLAAAFGHLGHIEQAREQWSEVRKINPNYSLEHRRIALPFKDPADFEKIISGLRKAGVLKDQEVTQDNSLPLPDKPSIAVLPFDNMSGDPEQEYFSDGITEDIITGLSAFRSLFVIARNSTFTYKGKPVNVTEVARDLGVRYVMEGSVRKAGNRVRISAQLIDARGGHHVWAERYDRELEDIFAVQDEITERVVTTVVPALDQAEQERAARKPPDSLDTWDCYQRGVWHMNQRRLREFRVARAHFREAIRQAPRSPLGYIGLAYLGTFEAMIAMQGPGSDLLAEIDEAARTAVTLDEFDAMAHVVMGWGKTLRRESLLAIPEFERAVQLNPNNALSYSGLGAALTFAGRVDDGIGAIETAVRLSPRDPNRPYWQMTTAGGLFVTERYEAALADLDVVQGLEPRWTATLTLRAAILAALGEKDQARALKARVSEITPDFKPTSIAYVFPFIDDTFIDKLRGALESADWRWQ